MSGIARSTAQRDRTLLPTHPLIHPMHSSTSRQVSLEAAAAALAGNIDDGGAPSAFDAYAVDVDERAEAALHFDPARGNVVFASAYDGWACTVDDFAALAAKKTGLPRHTLRRALWGEYCIHPQVRCGSAGLPRGRAALHRAPLRCAE